MLQDSWEILRWIDVVLGQRLAKRLCCVKNQKAFSSSCRQREANQMQSLQCCGEQQIWGGRPQGPASR